MLNNLDPGKRLLVYLVVNVIVSALTTLIVLMLWSQMTLASLPEFGSEPTATAASLASPVSINAIIGAGDLANERVVIVHGGASDISLAGWRLRDSNGNEYRFPALILHPGAQVNVYTTNGEDGAATLYWDRSVAAWSSGEQATLVDASGTVQSTYTVP